jgi:hypothetical protein
MKVWTETDWAGLDWIELSRVKRTLVKPMSVDFSRKH